MSRTLKEFYPALVALALLLSLLYDGALFIMTMAAAIAALPLAYAQDAHEIARQVRARGDGNRARDDRPGERLSDQPDDRGAPG